MSKVENLKKISILFKAGTSADTMDLTPKYPEFEFIYGIGSSGITPFEYDLSDKTVGEAVTISLKKEDFQRYFEHLYPPIMDLFEDQNGIFLNVKIEAVASADNREIVKALAETADSGGCEGDCGCGCGEKGS